MGAAHCRRPKPNSEWPVYRDTGRTRLPIHGVIDWLSHRNVLAGPPALNLKGRIGEAGAGRGDTDLLYGGALRTARWRTCLASDGIMVPPLWYHHNLLQDFE
jgi:hypothetical protein